MNSTYENEVHTAQNHEYIVYVSHDELGDNGIHAKGFDTRNEADAYRLEMKSQYPGKNVYGWDDAKREYIRTDYSQS